MPQIYMILTSDACTILRDRLEQLAPKLISAVEKVWGLEELNDVAFTAISPTLFTLGETDVQIEIRYTAGEDEYDRGEPFDPSLGEQEELAEQIKQTFRAFLAPHYSGILPLSVWCKPYYHSAFKDFS